MPTSGFAVTASMLRITLAAAGSVLADWRRTATLVASGSTATLAPRLSSNPQLPEARST